MTVAETVMRKRSVVEPMDRDWRAEGDHRTLMDAADIQNDRSRMVGVGKHHRKQTKKLSLLQRTMMAKGR